MPRQILPGRDFKQWAPPDGASEEERKRYVFPELWVDDIPADKWNDNNWLEGQPEDVQERRRLRGSLDVCLYGALLLMFQERFYTINENNWFEYAQEIIKNTVAPTVQLQFALEGMALRIAHSFPTGHYVSKG